MKTLDKCQKPLTRDAIKYIAMFTMLLNHIADIFLQTGTWLCEIFIALGYFTAISMIYFLVEGYDYTHSKKKYFLRLMIFGLISEIPYCLALTTEGTISFCGLNMMFTLALCFGLIWIMDNMKSTIMKVILSVLIIVLSILCSWAILAPIYTLLFIWAKSSQERKKAAFLISIILFGLMNFLGGIEHFTTSENILYALLSMIGMGLAGFCILYLYNGKQAVKGRKFSKWFFYTFYPAHLLILGIIRISIM
jgi:hypothetical protein